MKRTISFFAWILVFPLIVIAQERPKGAIIAGGSLSADFSSRAWYCNGSIVGGVFLVKNFAVGTEVTLSIDQVYQNTIYNTMSASLFTRFHCPFFKPLFIQVGSGNTFYNSTNNSPGIWYWYPRLGLDIDILKTIILEWSISRYFVFPAYAPSISTRLSILILLNRKSK
jgi:hypothetical protein